MLPICTWTVLMGQVLADSCTLGVDMMNLLLSFVCTSSQDRFQRSQGTVSATGKMSSNYAL